MTQETNKGISTTSLILGILGFILIWLPCGGFLSIPFILAGFIMAIISVINEKNALTISAITINSAAVFWLIIYYIILGIIFTSSLTK